MREKEGVKPTMKKIIEEGKEYFGLSILIRFCIIILLMVHESVKTRNMRTLASCFEWTGICTDMVVVYLFLFTSVICVIVDVVSYYRFMRK